MQTAPAIFDAVLPNEIWPVPRSIVVVVAAVVVVVGVGVVYIYIYVILVVFSILRLHGWKSSHLPALPGSGTSVKNESLPPPI